MRALCLLLGVVLFSCLACGSFVETVRTSTLSTDQEVPTILDPPPSAGIGICILARNRDPPVLDCEVQHDVSDVTGAHIHVSPRGSAGPVVYSFSSFAANHFRESFSIEGTETYPAAAQINDFLSGHWYINVHSLDYPSGEVRGQLENTDRFYARLSTSNTIPHASGTSSHGLAVGTFSAQNPLRELAFDIVHSVQQPLTSGLEIRQGAPGQIGPLVYSFRNAQSPAYETVEYTINEQAEFLKDLHYLNVLSTRNPTGEIRGQMVTIDYIDQLSFTARLDAEQAVPQTNSNNRGAALFAYHCDTKILEYVLMHNVPDARGAFISAAPVGEPGVTLFSLGSGTSPIYGAIQLTTQEELLLYSFGLYTSVISVEFPQGEIRGQITVENDWWAYLSGTNVVSPVTTPAMGIATMHLYGEQNRRLDYSIFHSVQSPLRASINVAREGENGPLDLVFPSAFSPVRGNDIVFDDDELEAFVTEGSYITLTSVNYPFTGEVRGQIRRVNPCKASNDNSLTVSISGGDAKMITENEIEKEEQENISFYAAEIPQSVDDTQSEDEILMGSNPYYFNQQTGSGTLLTPAFILSFCLSLLITYL